jgi:uncharacterized protein
MESEFIYSLVAGQQDSRSYYQDIDTLIESWNRNAQQIAGKWIAGYQNYRRNQHMSERSFPESAYELLVLAVLISERSAEATSLSPWASWVLTRLVELQGRLIPAETIIKRWRGWIGRLVRRPRSLNHGFINNIDHLITWLNTRGETGQAERLASWRAYFSTLPTREIMHIQHICKILVEIFSRQSAAKLNRYSMGVEPFLAQARLSGGGRYDSSLRASSRLEYHLGMMGTELLSRSYRERFKAAKRKVVVLPPCMRIEPEAGCQARLTSLGAQCAHCNSLCRIHQITVLGEKRGFEVYSIPDDLRGLGVEACRTHEGMGVVGVACALTAWTGGWELDSAGVPAQGVLLDYPGCADHWSDKGITTKVNINKLLETLALEEPAPIKKEEPSMHFQAAPAMAAEYVE